MTLHTPVVITDDDSTAAEARRRHWPVVTRDGDTLRLTGVGQTAPLPQPRMDIAGGSLHAEHASGWKFVLDWLAKHLHRPMIITEPGAWAHELALWSTASRGWPHRLADRLDDLPEEPLVDNVPPAQPSPSARQRGTTRVLLVAHDLGSRRTAGWFSQLEHASGGDVTVDLATSLTPAGDSRRVHVVPDLGIATLAPHDGPIDAVAQVALTHAVDAPFDPMREPAGFWQLALERHFEARNDHYDVVVLAGPPFAHFGFAAWAQRN